jgi:glycosyltransferase involved in cell wall biosynthesis
MLLMPSRYHEFSPYSALEAMASGVPVVATRMGGLPELIGDGVAADEVAPRMRALWSHPDERRREGESLLARAREAHSEERYTSALLSLYERLV